MYLTNGRIFTMSEKYGTIENGFVQTDGAVIKSVGTMDDFNAGHSERVIDLHGMTVTPGLIDCHTHLGMSGDALGFESDETNEENDPCTPQLRAVDAINPLDRCFEETLAAGVTAVVSGMGSANPIAGQMAAIKTSGKRIDDMIIKFPCAFKFAMGENPKSVYNGKNQMPTTRMATAAIIRENLLKAQEYADALEKYQADEENESKPDFDIKCHSLIPLLKRQTKAHFHAHRADDIFSAIRIAKEFNLDYAIIHGTEGHLIADELAAENVSVAAGPFLTDRSKPELRELTPKTAGILAKKGVLTAICTDHPVIPLKYISFCLALAVKEGMDKYDALRAVTINAAKIAGIEHRVGSIEPGKDADIAVFSSDPCDVTGEVAAVFVNGRQVAGRDFEIK